MLRLIITIPKLELQAALLAANLRQKILSAITFDVPQSFMWTDSSKVLQWLASADKQPVFVVKPQQSTNGFTFLLLITPQTLKRAGSLHQIFQVVACLKGLTSLEHPTGRLNRNHPPFTLLSQWKLAGSSVSA